MLGRKRLGPIVVRTYQRAKDYESDAAKLARAGYVVDQQSGQFPRVRTMAKRVGVTVTYKLAS